MAAWNPQANDIFLAAVEIQSLGDRRTYLDEACHGDAQLRGQVDALIAAGEQAGSFLESPVPGVTAVVDSSELGEKPGSVIGPYKLLQQIGEGGMGVVWMAEQTQPVQRKVALKVIKPGMDSRQVIARFEAERQALAMMDHVNIARVLDAGTTESGLPYFVMELVHGVPITQYCDDNHLTPRERLELFVAVCQAIQHAHQKGIIHRDIKPSNVMITLYDGKPVPKVIDFGVSKATEQKLTERTLFTQYGTMVGTLEYMSPEQAEMSALGVDTRSDIYSLGALFYELLTGSTPLTHKRMKDAAYAEVLRLIKEEEPPRPSTRLSDSGEALASISAQRHMEPAKLTKLVRGELDWIVMKTLEKDRNRRYETANGLAQDVQNYLADEPVQACPPSTAYRFRKFARRNRRTLATAALLGAAALVAVGGVAWSVGWANRDRAARQAVVDQEADLALNEADRLAEQQKWPEALSAVKRAEGLLATGGGDAARERVRELRRNVEMVLRLDDAHLQALQGSEKDGNFDWAAMDAAIAKAFRDFGIDVEKLPSNRAAELIRARPIRLELTAALDDWVRTTPSKELGTKLRGLVRAADPDEWRNRARDARWAGERSQARLAELAASDQVRTQRPTAVRLLAYALARAGLTDDVVALFRDAQLHHPDDFWANYDLAWILQQKQPPPWDEVVRFYSTALALRPNSPPVLCQLGFALGEQGRPDLAIAYFKKVIELDPNNALAEQNLGVYLERLGRLDEGIARYQRASEMEPNNALYLTNLGGALRDKDRVDEAIGYFRRAIAANSKYARAYIGLATALRMKGQLDEGIAAHWTAIELDPADIDAIRGLGETLEKVAESKPKDPQAHFQLGSVYAQLGRWGDAIRAYDRGLELEPTNHGGWILAATLYAATGNVEGYRRTCRTLLERFGDTDSAQTAEQTAKACSLLPGALTPADAERVQKLATRAVTGTEKDAYYDFFAMARGLVEYRAGRHADAVTWMERSHPHPDGPHWDAIKFAVLAMAHYRLGHSKEADAALASAKPILAKMPDLAKGQPFGSGNWHDWLHARILCSEAESAPELLEPTLKSSREEFGRDQPETLKVMADLARRYMWARRYAEAAGSYEELLASRKARLGAGHPDTLDTMQSLAVAYSSLSRDADAAKLLEEALKLERARTDENRLLFTMRQLAVCYGSLGRHADALKLYEEMLQRRKVLLGPDDARTVFCLRFVAETLIELGRGAEAVPMIDECVPRLSGNLPWSLIEALLDARMRHFEKITDPAGCRATAEMWEKHCSTSANATGRNLYVAARYRAITATVIRAADRSGRAAEEANAEADRAMAWLRKAVTAGSLIVADLKQNKHLEALRGREDFQKLVAELEAKK